MSEWISQGERDRFEAWRDEEKLQAGNRAEEMIVFLTRLRLKTKDAILSVGAATLVSQLEDFYTITRGIK